ncbi:MAG: hypothetical protein Q8Q89_04880 [bacterium]|nr:hypothetical protein [bacterium]
MKKFSVAVVLWMLAPSLVIASNDQEPISLDVTPKISFTLNGNREYKRVVIRVERHPDNRLLRLQWESPDGEEGSTERELEGENSPAIFTGEDFLGRRGLVLSPGHYVVRAILTRLSGDKFIARQETVVLTDVGEEEDR